MIDLHCHLLPNIDDGPKSWEESIEMVSIAHKDGIKGAQIKDSPEVKRPFPSRRAKDTCKELLEPL